MLYYPKEKYLKQWPLTLALSPTWIVLFLRWNIFLGFCCCLSYSFSIFCKLSQSSLIKLFSYYTLLLFMFLFFLLSLSLILQLNEQSTDCPVYSTEGTDSLSLNTRRFWFVSSVMFLNDHTRYSSGLTLRCV